MSKYAIICVNDYSSISSNGIVHAVTICTTHDDLDYLKELVKRMIIKDPDLIAKSGFTFSSKYEDHEPSKEEPWFCDGVFKITKENENRWTNYSYRIYDISENFVDIDTICLPKEEPDAHIS